jgi:hypothetical protein
MPTFQFTLAHDVSVYGYVEVEADNLAAAVEKVRKEADPNVLSEDRLWDNVSDVDYSTSHNFRIVSVDDEDDNNLLEQIDLDGTTAEEVLAVVTAERIS